MQNDLNEQVDKFLASKAFGVAGASSNRAKYGNKVLRCYQQNNMTAFPINPKETEVEGIESYPDVASLPDSVDSISIITPPPITEKLVDAIIARGISNVWMQPGAESGASIEKCKKNNINVIANGPCILVKLGYKE